MPTKSSLRTIYKAKRRELSAEQIKDYSCIICNNVIASDVLSSSQVIHIFLPIERHREVDTWILIRSLWTMKKSVVVSSWDISTDRMRHYLLSEDTNLVESSFGVPEPVGECIEIKTEYIDAVIVPLLAFDGSGHRVGYGRGVYDRFLNECRDDILRIGLSFFSAEQNIEDKGEWDVRLDYCFSPENKYIFIT